MEHCQLHGSIISTTERRRGARDEIKEERKHGNIYLDDSVMYWSSADMLGRFLIMIISPIQCSQEQKNHLAYASRASAKWAYDTVIETQLLDSNRLFKRITVAFD